MYDLRQLEVLVAIADHGGFTLAAEALHIAQPAVSQHMKSLETTVGGELIDRKTKRPTAAGVVLIAHARRAFRELETAEREVDELSGLHRGTVRIGAIHWLEPLDLPALLGAFALQYPGITIELREENAHVMFDLLGVGDMDLVFSNISPTDTITSDLRRKNLFSEDLVVVVGEGDPLGDHHSCDLAELRQLRLIAFRRGSAFFDTVDRSLRRSGVVPHIVMETSDLAMVRSLVSRGLGVAIIPRSLAEAGGPPVKVVEVRPEPPRRTVALTWNARGGRSSAAEAFLEFALRWLSDPGGDTA